MQDDVCHFCYAYWKRSTKIIFGITDKQYEKRKKNSLLIDITANLPVLEEGSHGTTG